MLLRQSPAGPFRALTEAFLGRFFENEITTGIDDLKGAFFWMLAALAMPGLFLPWMMSFDWHLIGMFRGPEALREASQDAKVFYLGLAMIASGVLTLTAWSSLLPDRRDTLILGTLPVAPATIVGARLTALAVYLLLVAVAMHALAAVCFGLMLAVESTGLFAVRGIVAHFAAASAAGASVALCVTAAQGAALALAGPRFFRPMSTVLHAGLAGLMALGLASILVITFSVVHTVRGYGGNLQPWILFTPPVWFLGLYECILGTSNPVLLGLARNAILLLAVALAVTLVSYPIAYRRLMVSSVDHGGASSHGIGSTLRGLMIRTAGRDPEVRGAADFYVATITRVERHRFVMAIALGLAVAWVLGGWTAIEPSSRPAAAWLSLPLSSMMFLLAGFRIAASLPGDVRAGWLFDLKEPSRAQARQAMERVMILLAVVPPALLSAGVYWSLWGRDVALIHAAVSLVVGTTIVELLIWERDRIPCGHRWNPGSANLGYRLPIYLGVFLVVTVWIPRLEVFVLSNAYAAAFISLLIAVAAAVRYASASHVIVPAEDTVDAVAGVLRLD